MSDTQTTAALLYSAATEAAKRMGHLPVGAHPAISIHADAAVIRELWSTEGVEKMIVGPEKPGDFSLMTASWKQSGVTLTVMGRDHYKTCTCCGRSYSPETWADLEHVGEQVHEEGGIRWTVTMKNCPCGSTIAVERVETTEAPYVLP